MRDDAELLRRYANGADDRAFRSLVERHLALVYSAALRQVGGDHLLAEDVTQSVFCDLARNAQEFEANRLIVPWLYRATRFAASVAVRGESRRRSREHAYAEQMDKIQAEPAPPDEGESSWDAAAAHLDSAVDDLSEADRDAILLRFFDGLDFRAVGEALRTNDDTAQKRVSRALEKLRLLLAQRGVALTGAALAAFLSERVAAAQAPEGLVARILEDVGAPPAGAGHARPPSVSKPAFTITAGALALGVILALALAWSRGPLGASHPASEWKGLVSHWTGEGHAEDARGRNHGTLQGNVTFVPGPSGMAFHFDGQDGTEVVVPHSASLNLTNEITIACWFCPDDDSDMGTLVAKRGPGVGAATNMNINYMLYLGPVNTREQWGMAAVFNDVDVDGGYHLSERAHGTNFVVNRRNKLEQLACFPGPEHDLASVRGQWHHFAGTFRQLPGNKVELAIHFDGVIRGRCTMDGSLTRTTSAEQLHIGGFRTAWFKGSLDEIHLFERVLTEAEIQRLAAPPNAALRHTRR